MRSGFECVRRFVAGVPDLNRNALVNFAFAAGNVAGGNKSGGGPAFIGLPLDPVPAGLAIEPDAVQLVEAYGAAAGEVADADQFAAGGAQHGILVGAFHLRNNHGRQDPQKNDHHHQLDQREAELPGAAGSNPFHRYQFPMSAPSPSPPSALSAPRDQTSKLDRWWRPGARYSYGVPHGSTRSCLM